ncbi:MAG: hypothetical protein HRU41_39435 [Saprospiraceae bacterium]|nr:hypothetical protein [Saprospiraceae bacterium]
MNNYSFRTEGTIQVIKVGDLLNEFVVKEILAAAQVKIEEGFSNFAVNFLILLKKGTSAVGGEVAIVKAPIKVIHLLQVTKLRPLFYLTKSLDEGFDCLLNGEPLEAVR